MVVYCLTLATSKDHKENEWRLNEHMFKGTIVPTMFCKEFFIAIVLMPVFFPSGHSSGLENRLFLECFACLSPNTLVPTVFLRG